MRQLTYVIFSLFILASCSNNKTSIAEKEAAQIDSLKQVFIPVLSGAWVMTDYINAIEETKSPLKSADKLQGVVSMTIDSTIKSDSIEVVATWNNHEGYDFTTYFQSGQKQNSLKTSIPDYDEKSNYYELGYETLNDETFLFLCHYNNTNELIDKRQFSKVADKQQGDDAASGLQYMVNEKLFSGEYLLIDSKNSKTKVNLNSDGSITGHSEFKTFYVFTDFLGGPEQVLDQMAFNVYEKNVKVFAFIVKKDAIYLYNTIGDEDAGELLKLGKIQYKLVRQ